jgi:hypothetical protein
VVNLETEHLPRTRGSKRLYPTGGQLDVRTKTWLPLPHRPPGDGPNWFTTSGGDVAIQDGWALDVPAGTWTKMPQIPNGPSGLTFTALAFTGNALLTWGGRIPDGGDYMHAKSYSTIDRGWVWERAAQPDTG